MTAESRQKEPGARASNQQWAEMRRSQRRPTAPQSFQRPPDPGAETSPSWWPVFWLFCLIIITALMVSRQLTTPPVALSDLGQAATALLPSQLNSRITNILGNSGDQSLDEQIIPQPSDGTSLSEGADPNERMDLVDSSAINSNAVDSNSRWSLQNIGENIRDLIPPSIQSLGFSARTEQPSDVKFEGVKEEDVQDEPLQEGEARLVFEDNFQPLRVSQQDASQQDTSQQDTSQQDVPAPRVSLASSAETERWMMDFLPTTQEESGQAGNSQQESVKVENEPGIYRMRVWPNTIAWTTLGQIPLPKHFRLETTMQINPLVPDGYGGFLARYQDEENYYLFQFDGKGHYRSLLRKGGEWSSPQEWVNTTAINLAGQTNKITLEEREDLLRLYVNNALIDELKPLLPQGNTGFIAGAKADQIIEVDYFGLALYELY